MVGELVVQELLAVLSDDGVIQLLLVLPVEELGERVAEGGE